MELWDDKGNLDSLICAEAFKHVDVLESSELQSFNTKTRHSFNKVKYYDSPQTRVNPAQLENTKPFNKI